MKTLLLYVAAAFCLVPIAFAEPAKDFKDYKQAPPEDLFKNTEWQFDVFASYGFGENERRTKTLGNKGPNPAGGGENVAPFVVGGQFRVRVALRETLAPKRTTKTTGHTGLFEQDNAFGGGVAINYYFARYFGMGVEGDWLAGEEAIHLLHANLFLRYPINFDFAGARRGLAPYAFGGYGARFDGAKWGIGHVGAGIEFRFCPAVAWFGDGRFIFGHRDAETGLFRTGLRLVF